MKGLRDQGRIGVLMGGVSAERRISLRTGEAITKALIQRGYNVCPIDVGYDIAQRLTSEGILRGASLKTEVRREERDG